MATKKIVKVIFHDRTMLFGNSYKPWEMQYKEYVILCKRNGTTLLLQDVETSPTEWIGWGGLKWCPEAKFQAELNREGCQQNEPDNPNPRQYQQMVFSHDAVAFQKAKQLLTTIYK